MKIIVQINPLIFISYSSRYDICFIKNIIKSEKKYWFDIFVKY